MVGWLSLIAEAIDCMHVDVKLLPTHCNCPIEQRIKVNAVRKIC